MTSQEARLVLGNKGTVTSAEYGDFLLYVLDVIIAGFKIDLGGRQSTLKDAWLLLARACLMATTSPDASSIAL